jgi:uncharacterized protein related to proFAR isomerase
MLTMTAIQITSRLTAKQIIHKLANQHGVVHHHSELDEWCDKVSELSDGEVELDETQLILVELDRAGILTGKDNTILHGRYLQEREV